MNTLVEQYPGDATAAMLDSLAHEHGLAEKAGEQREQVALVGKVSDALSTLVQYAFFRNAQVDITGLVDALEQDRGAFQSFDPTRGNGLLGGIAAMRGVSEVPDEIIDLYIGAWAKVSAPVKVSTSTGKRGESNPENPLTADLGFRVEVLKGDNVLAGTGKANSNSLLDQTRKALGKASDPYALRLTRGDVAHKSLSDAIRKVMDGETKVDAGDLVVRRAS